jgi:hypothetical protein
MSWACGDRIFNFYISLKEGMVFHFLKYCYDFHYEAKHDL